MSRCATSSPVCVLCPRWTGRTFSKRSAWSTLDCGRRLISPRWISPTRNEYRTAIEVLARGSALDELEVTEAALAQAAHGETDFERDPGYALIGAGRAVLERTIGFAPPAAAASSARAAAGSVSAAILRQSLLVSLGLVSLALWLGFAGIGPCTYVLLCCPGPGRGIEAGTALVNMVVTRAVRPRPLPGLDLAQGVPDHLRTLVAVPVILSRSRRSARVSWSGWRCITCPAPAARCIMRCCPTAPMPPPETTPEDAPLIAAAIAGIARLNAAYPSAGATASFCCTAAALWNPA